MEETCVLPRGRRKVSKRSFRFPGDPNRKSTHRTEFVDPTAKEGIPGSVGDVISGADVASG